MDFLRELRYALRGLVRSPTVTAALLVSLGLGTGANAAVFGLVNALLFRAPAGVGRPSELVSLYTSGFNAATYGQSSYPDFLSLKTRAAAFSNLAAADTGTVATVGAGGVERTALVAAVSADYFSTLRLRPLRGQLQTTASPGAGRPAVVSEALWRALNGGDEIVGRRISIGGVDHVVAGVAPPRFHGHVIESRIDAWIGLEPSGAAAERGRRALSLIGRLRSGVALEGAQHDVDAIAAALADEYPASNRGTVTLPDAPRRMTVVRYSRLAPGLRGQMTLLSAILVGATVLVLLSACVNAGNLLLSRATARGREMAVKIALGAGHRRLVRQLLTEGFLVALGGASVGLVFATWAIGAFPALFAPEHAELLDPRIDTAVIAVTLAIAVAGGVGFSFAPAMLARRTSAARALKSDPGGVSNEGGTHARAALVGAQVALSTLLLVTTLLLNRSLGAALGFNVGFATRRVIAASVVLDPARSSTDAAAIAERVRKVAGIRHAGWVETLPLGAPGHQVLGIETHRPGVSDSVELEVNVASPEYFGVLRIPRIDGRLYDDGDGPLAPLVVVVNDVLATTYFGQSAVGRHLLDARGRTLEIVGVIRTGKYRTLQASPRPTVYYPLAQRGIKQAHLVIGTDDEPSALLVSEVRAALRAAGTSVTRLTTLEAHLAEALALDRFVTTFVSACGLMALLLAVLGVHGVMSDEVARRTAEIGLRVALGAGRRQVAWFVFGRGLGMTTAGIGAGLVGAAITERVARSLLFGAPVLDVTTATLVAAGMIAVVVFAAIVPTRRALRVSPMDALRHE